MMNLRFTDSMFVYFIYYTLSIIHASIQITCLPLIVIVFKMNHYMEAKYTFRNDAAKSRLVLLS